MVNAGADVFALTVGTAAFESAIPAAVRVLGEGFEPADEVTIGHAFRREAHPPKEDGVL